MLYLCIYLSGRNLRYVDKRQPGGKTHYPLGGYPPDIRRILKYLRQIARETSSTRRRRIYVGYSNIYIFGFWVLPPEAKPKRLSHIIWKAAAAAVATEFCFRWDVSMSELLLAIELTFLLLLVLLSLLSFPVNHPFWSSFLHLLQSVAGGWYRNEFRWGAFNF